MSLESQVRREIEELHEVFEAWLAGSAEASLASVEDSLASDFRMVSPSGQLVERGPLLSGLHAARGRSGEGFRIEVREVTARELGTAGLVLATYQEWQDDPGSLPRGRQSSALLRARPGAGFDWLHVHETWLPEREPGAC